MHLLKRARVPMWLAAVAGLTLSLRAQERPPPGPADGVPLQPLAQQVRRLESALRYLGQPLAAADHLAINEAVALSDEKAAASRLQELLDRHVLPVVRINP